MVVDKKRVTVQMLHRITESTSVYRIKSGINLQGTMIAAMQPATKSLLSLQQMASFMVMLLLTLANAPD